MKLSWAIGPLFFAFAFLTYPALGDDCSFADGHEQFDPDQAEADAHASADDGDFKFFGVADGIGPSRPGFEGVQLTKCLIADAKWEMLWVGADASTCEDSEILMQKATRYAKLFNTEMLKLVAENPSFVCSDDLGTTPQPSD